MKPLTLETHEEAERFVVSWESAASVAEASKAFGCTPDQAIQKAKYLRRKGVPLKYMGPLRRQGPDFKKLAEVVTAARPVPKLADSIRCTTAGCLRRKAEGRERCVDCLIEAA